MPRRPGEPHPQAPSPLRGRRGKPSSARRGVDDIQRSRVLAALRETVADEGVAAATVAQVVARAGVSRRTFYELFADREECFIAAFDQAVATVRRRVEPAFRGPGRWRARVRAALAELLALFEEEPELGALCVVHALGAGPRALERRSRVVRVLVAAVDEGREEARAGREPGPLVAEGVVGAVLAVLHARLLDSGLSRLKPAGPRRSAAEPLTALTAPLMSLIALPYLGAAVADRELARPAPKPARPRRSSVREDPLNGLHMRLTYRTVRVLGAIADRPGASNRDVAHAAGIADQGQTSKLLQRLQQLGLIENGAHGAGARGEPNAWRLTSRGRRLQLTIHDTTGAEG